MRKLIPVIFIFVSAVSFGVPFNSIDILGGMLWIGNGERPDETTGAPSPLSQEIGVSLPMPLGSLFVLDPGIYLYGMEYGYDEGPRPRPIQIENREMFVLNWIVDLTLLVPFRVIDRLFIAPGISLTGIFRLPLIVAPGEEDSSSDMNSYFYGSTRYFFPGACIKASWDFSDRFACLVKTGTRLPVFHFWDGESVPFYDQMQVYLDIGFSYKFGSAATSGNT